MIRKASVLILFCTATIGFTKIEIGRAEQNNEVEVPVVISRSLPSPLVVTVVSLNEKLHVSDSWMEAMRLALPDVLEKYRGDIEEASRMFGYDPRLIAGVLMAESTGDPYALSSANARGCMQTTKVADIDIGMEQENSFNCHISIVKGSKYLALIRDEQGFHNPFAAVIAYRDGYGNASEYSMKKILSDSYVHKIKAVMREIPDGTFS